MTGWASSFIALAPGPARYPFSSSIGRWPNLNRGVGEWGNNRIQVRIDDMASREMELTVKEGETVDLGCRAVPSPCRMN